MPVKIRLSRHGRKAKPFYHIVVADSRSPRDGRYIELLGTYNPHTKPATVELNFERALTWLQNGAQPTDTARSILSTEGVLLKNHLLKGITKGALTAETADSKFEAWKQERSSKVNNYLVKLKDDAKAVGKKRLEAEAMVNQKRVDEMARKKAEAEAKLVQEINEAATENQD